jgi:hypothetical protein
MLIDFARSGRQACHRIALVQNFGRELGEWATSEVFVGFQSQVFGGPRPRREPCRRLCACGFGFEHFFRVVTR